MNSIYFKTVCQSLFGTWAEITRSGYAIKKSEFKNIMKKKFNSYRDFIYNHKTQNINADASK